MTLETMTPEARATYDRIRALRAEIGPLDFDIVGALRELRGEEPSAPEEVSG